jgi:aspartate carbamoyltransferase regulatory subunit
MKKDKTQLKVSAIKNGTVIDHIPAQNLFKVISILGLDQIETYITFGTNLESQKLGRKAIIKIADNYFDGDEINKIALVAPDANLNVINNYTVVEKKRVKVPDNVLEIVKCFNPKCITNHEDITTNFSVIQKGKEVALKCHYCEKITDQEHMNII